MKPSQAKKRFGQNFLNNPDIIAQLIHAIQPDANDCMVEIGPGLGALTTPLLQSLQHLHVVEIDRDIIQWMKTHHPMDKITIHQGDILKFDIASLGRQVRVVGNLPYNISSPILFRLLEVLPHIQDMHFMLQKEVVERMVGVPGTSAYGRLSVMLQYHLQMEYLFTVPADAFNPAPKVESAFVRCIPYPHPPYPAKDLTLFAKIVQAAFSQRRKTLRNTLKGLLNDDDFAQLGIDPQLRAENLGVASFVAMTNYLA